MVCETEWRGDLKEAGRESERWRAVGKARGLLKATASFVSVGPPSYRLGGAAPRSNNGLVKLGWSKLGQLDGDPNSFKFFFFKALLELQYRKAIRWSLGLEIYLALCLNLNPLVIGNGLVPKVIYVNFQI